MKTSEVLTEFPLQITFRDGTPPPVAEIWVRSEAAKLNRFYSRIMACRVAVENPHRHHKEGTPYHVRIDLTVPGGEIVVKHEPSLRSKARQAGEPEIRKRLEARTPHKYLRQAIDDAFKAAGRRLQDYARRQRGDVKQREPRPRAKVSQIFRDKDYGFLATPDGRDIYFHKDSVLNRAFGRLRIGTAVSFAEEEGEKGPQASTVRIVSKQGAGTRRRRPAA
ncbi:MAG TPA: HPF/RaiA family ribosome-associated protein [Candidatus Limnocylindrales bacterium]|nr:HPF/RaiA family ribosome-associated protein [Candidatus Limnocylindrales bacterium]